MTQSDLLKGLNPQQLAAVSAGAGATLVVAGPGSGKTAVLTRRVAYLIREMGVAPNHIMAVTFTNKAASEMLTRIEGLLDGRIRGLTVGTFHSICARILRREAESVGLKQNYAIYDTSDQISIMKAAIEEAKLDPDKNQPRRHLSKISNAKNELIEPDQFPIDNMQDRVTADLYRRYQKLMRAANAVDFDDLLMMTAILFRDKPSVLERYQGYYDYILVDEFQDTNTAQYQMVTLLAGTKRNLFCVGDPDQSIYRFRGADYRNVTNFTKDYPEAKIILLEQNYRSHQVILDAAMAVIDKNKDRIRKQLSSHRKDGMKITLKQAANEEYEAQFIVESVLSLKYANRATYNQIAIMYRTNAQSRAIEEAFVRSGVPYRLIGGTRFYDRREVKDLLAYLKVIHNPDDSLSLERIINVPARGIGKTTMAQFKAWSASRNGTLYEALVALRRGEESPLKGRAAKALSDFAGHMEMWMAVRDLKPVAAIITDVLESTSYRPYLMSDASTPEEGMERVENVNELQGMAFNAGEQKLGDFLEQVSLVSDVDSLDEQKQGVVMLTLHSAKGLEFPVVFLVGLEEGVLPHIRAIEGEGRGENGEEMEEERRLMYVGITRAKDLLYITWANNRSLYGGRGDRAVPSRFLEDIPASLTIGSPVPRRPSAERKPYDPFNPYGATEAPVAPWSMPKPAPKPGTPISPRQALNMIAKYKSGQKVLHSKFGEGIVIASKVRGDDEELDVKFANYGLKRLSAAIANLVLLEDED